MIFDRTNFSKRALSIIENLSFQNPNQTRTFDFSIGKNDKILTVHHNFDLNQDELSALLADVLCRLALDKTLKELWGLTFRELENFLRDENHRPAFNLHTDIAESEFKKLKLIFLGFGYSFLLEGFKGQFLAWQELSLVEKNQLAVILCQKLNWEFIFADNSSIHFISPYAWAQSADCHMFLEAALDGELTRSLIKVVAVVG